MQIDKIKQLFNAYQVNWNALILVIIGLLMVTGGSFGIRTSIGKEPVWFDMPKVDTWVAWCIVWFGMDEFAFMGKGTSFILDNTIHKGVRLIIGEDRIKKVPNIYK